VNVIHAVDNHATQVREQLALAEILLYGILRVVSCAETDPNKVRPVEWLAVDGGKG
jgi:hypothetical protein